MNANELAKELEQTPFESTRFEAAAMLRQQQAEIEALKKENEEISSLCFEFGILRKAQEK